jgi:hypothetical protein
VPPGRRHAAERVITQVSPRGETMYWIGGAGAALDDSEGTDFHATALGHVSVTPLKVDLTDHRTWATGRRRQPAVRRDEPAALRMQQRRLFSGRADASHRLCLAGSALLWCLRCGRGVHSGATGLGLDSAAVRARMVQRLAAGGVSSGAVLTAMGGAPPLCALVNQAYEDTSLPIGLGQTISKPSVVARMMELLLGAEIARSAAGLGRVLEIGTGCGYQAAVLAHLAREVYALSVCVGCTRRHAPTCGRCAWPMCI